MGIMRIMRQIILIIKSEKTRKSENEGTRGQLQDSFRKSEKKKLREVGLHEK